MGSAATSDDDVTAADEGGSVVVDVVVVVVAAAVVVVAFGVGFGATVVAGTVVDGNVVVAAVVGVVVVAADVGGLELDDELGVDELDDGTLDELLGGTELLDDGADEGVDEDGLEDGELLDGAELLDELDDATLDELDAAEDEVYLELDVDGHGTVVDSTLELVVYEPPLAAVTYTAPLPRLARAEATAMPLTINISITTERPMSFLLSLLKMPPVPCRDSRCRAPQARTWMWLPASRLPKLAHCFGTMALLWRQPKTSGLERAADYCESAPRSKPVTGHGFCDLA